MKKTLLWIFLSLPILSAVAYQYKDFENLLTYASGKSIVLVFACLNLMFFQIFILLRKKRRLRLNASLLFSLVVLPLIFPLSKWQSKLDSIGASLIIPVECPRSSTAAQGFDFTFGNGEELVAFRKASIENSSEKDDVVKPCIGRYASEPIISYFFRKSKIRILEGAKALSDLNVLNALESDFFKLKAGLHQLWRPDIDGVYLRPNVLVLYEKEVGLMNVKSVFQYLFIKGDVVKGVLLDKNIKTTQLEGSCRNQSLLNETIDKFGKIKVLSEACIQTSQAELARSCYEKKRQGHEARGCQIEKIREKGLELSYQYNREAQCDNDSIERSHLILCLSKKELSGTKQMEMYGRKLKVFLLNVGNDRESIVRSVKKDVLKIESIQNFRGGASSNSILDYYDNINSSVVDSSPRAFSFLKEYSELMKVRVKFLQRYSGVLND